MSKNIKKASSWKEYKSILKAQINKSEAEADKVLEDSCKLQTAVDDIDAEIKKLEDQRLQIEIQMRENLATRVTLSEQTITLKMLYESCNEYKPRETNGDDFWAYI